MSIAQRRVSQVRLMLTNFSPVREAETGGSAGAEDDGGCGCAQGGSGSGAGAWLLGFGVLGLRRRVRRLRG